MKVAVVMGSDSDFPILKPAVDLLHQFNVETEVIVASAHRTPGKVRDLVSSAEERGVGAFISAAGAAAHLFLSLFVYFHLFLIFMILLYTFPCR